MRVTFEHRSGYQGGNDERSKMYDDVSERYQSWWMTAITSAHVGFLEVKTFPIEQGLVLDLACATGSIGHVVKITIQISPSMV